MKRPSAPVAEIPVVRQPIAGTVGDWKPVPLRRVPLFIEQSLSQGLQWVVFEPNGAELWAAVRRDAEAFLLELHRQGVLKGAKPDQAFFVRCDVTTMTQNDLDNGRLVVEIGIATVRPAEFVIFRIGLWTETGQDGSSPPPPPP
ncbi:MAG TPA: phage tail sheath C-terminal domain-containing protein [Phenylobacterium sp.]|jgi:phage tail sheath protein FI|nr:phage tail sheath C-terminal domain-containing protein [Phenylobacterium sp.]